MKVVCLKKTMILLYIPHLSRMDNLLKRIFYLYSFKSISILSPVFKKLLGRNRNRDSSSFFDMESIWRRELTRYRTTDMRETLNGLPDGAWNDMSKTSWNDTLYTFDCAWFGKSVVDDGSTNDEIVDEESDNESVDDESVNESTNDDRPTIDKEFPIKRELYNHYGIDVEKTLDGHAEVWTPRLVISLYLFMYFHNCINRTLHNE